MERKPRLPACRSEACLRTQHSASSKSGLWDSGSGAKGMSVGGPVPWPASRRPAAAVLFPLSHPSYGNFSSWASFGQKSRWPSRSGMVLRVRPQAKGHLAVSNPNVSFFLHLALSVGARFYSYWPDSQLHEKVCGVQICFRPRLPVNQADTRSDEEAGVRGSAFLFVCN